MEQEPIGLPALPSDCLADIFVLLGSFRDLVSLALVSSALLAASKVDRVWMQVARLYLDLDSEMRVQTVCTDYDKKEAEKALKAPFTWREYCKSVFTLNGVWWEGQRTNHASSIGHNYPFMLHTRTSDFEVSDDPEKKQQLPANHALAYRLETIISVPYVPRLSEERFHDTYDKLTPTPLRAVMSAEGVLEGLKCRRREKSAEATTPVNPVRSVPEGRKVLKRVTRQNQPLPPPITLAYSNCRVISTRSGNPDYSPLIEYAKDDIADWETQLVTPRIKPLTPRHEPALTCDVSCSFLLGNMVATSQFVNHYLNIRPRHGCCYLVRKDVAYGASVFCDYFPATSPTSKQHPPFLKERVSHLFRGPMLSTMPLLSAPESRLKCEDCSLTMHSFFWVKEFSALKVHGRLNGGDFVAFLRESGFSERNFDGYDDGEPVVRLTIKGIYQKSVVKIHRLQEIYSDPLENFWGCENFDFVGEVRADSIVGMSEKSWDTPTGAFAFCVKRVQSLSS